MSKEKEQKEKSEMQELWGLDEETVEKAMEINPVLKLGRDFPYNTPLDIEFTEDKAKEVETPNSDYGDKSTVINVRDLVTNIDYSMFLSSKSLRLGVAKLWVANNKSLIGVKARIVKTQVEYKKFGLNDCYTVQQIKGEYKNPMGLQI